MYKIIQNNKIVDVVKNPYFITFLATGHITSTDKTNAMGIIGSDNTTIYSFVPNKRSDIQLASIEKISFEEFSRLKSLLNSGQEILADTTTLTEVKQKVIKRLSNICKNKITAGFSIELSDGNTYEFKLTTEDQLNLMMIENQLLSGSTTFIYHATNQPCKVYTKEDMTKIINAFKKHTLYHTTYFNAAKHFIMSQSNINDINLFSYGTDISDTVEDAVLRQILKNGDAQQ